MICYRLLIFFYHWGVESGPAGPLNGAALVGLDSAGREEELHLLGIGGHLDVGQSLGPGGGADEPQEGEHHRDDEVLTEERGQLNEPQRYFEDAWRGSTNPLETEEWSWSGV